MQLSEILSPSRVACGVHSGSKKRALEFLSEMINSDEPSLSQNEIFESLLSRERLGSTGLGKGIAIPHGRFKQSDKTIAAFLQLDEPVDYDAPDGEPVDLVCALLVPPESTDEHLQILALLTEMFRDPAVREKLRKSQDPKEIYQLLSEWSSTVN